MTKKDKLKRILIALKPEERVNLDIADLKKAVKNIKDYTPEITRLQERLTGIADELDKKIETVPEPKDYSPELAELSKQINDLSNELQSFSTDELSEQVLTLQENHLTTLDGLKKEINKVRLEALNKGGGNQNRKITVDGVDVLNKYTDINFYGPTSSIVTTVDNTKKTVNIPLGGDPVWGSITGTLSDQTDLQAALDGKVNNPISTTRVNLYDTLIAGALLVPEQWYLITDYQTEDYVQSTNNTVFRSAPVEQIYVKAATTTTLYPTAFSKDYPDEQLIFTQDIPDTTGNIQGYFESGMSQGPNLIDNFTTSGFDLDVDGHSPLTGTGLYTSGYDGVNNTYFDIGSLTSGFITFISYDGSNNTNDYYQRTVDVTSAALLDIQLDLSGLSWSDYANDNSFYLHISDRVNSIDYDFSEADIGVNITIDSSGLVTYIGPNTFDATGATVYGTWNTTATAYTWTAGGTFTLLHRNNFDFTNIEAGNGNISCGFTYLIYSYYGRITKRHNLKNNIQIDIDYRGYKFRRYELAYTAWSAGSYSAGSVVSYGGYLYLAIFTTSATPGAIYSSWALIGQQGLKVSPYTAIQIMGYSLAPNYASYTDYDMINLNSLPTDMRVFNTNTSPLNSPLDAVFHSTPFGVTVRCNATKLTVISTFSACDFDTSGSLVLYQVSNCSGVLSGGWIHQMSACKIGLFSISYFKNTTNMSVGTVSYSAILQDATSSQITNITTSVITGGITSSTIISISTCTFKNAIQSCFIQSMSGCTIENFFFSNICLASVSNCTMTDFYGNTTYASISNSTFVSTSLNIFFSTVGSSTLTGTVSNNKFFKNLASVTVPVGVTVSNTEFYSAFSGTTFVAISQSAYTVPDGTSFQPYAGLALYQRQTNTQAAGKLTINSPLGTADNGGIIKFVLKCTNPQYLVWNANFSPAPGLSLPTKTAGGSVTEYYTFQYNSSVGWIMIDNTSNFSNITTQNLNAVFLNDEVISYGDDMVFY